MPEPTNPYDPNAVMVIIDGLKVGYLSRDDAAAYIPFLQQHIGSTPPVRCDAMICGGWSRGRRGSGHYGVKLDLTFPPEMEWVDQ